jgi:hypothetical protein
MKRVVVGSMVVAFVVSACASAKDPAKGGLDLAAFGDAYCQRVATCCDSAGLKSTCVDGVAALGGHYDAAKAQACLGELDGAAGNADFCDLKLAGTPSCNEVLVVSGSAASTHGAGDACANDTDCAPLADAIVVCARPPGTTNGTCRAGTYGKEGQPCVATLATSGLVVAEPSAKTTRGAICEAAAGLFCDPTTATCNKQRVAGDACDSSTVTVGCEETASCDLGSKTCVARAGVGAKCSSSAACEVTAQCDATSKCVALRSAGASCDGNTDCVSSFCNTRQKCAPGGPGGVGAGTNARGVFCSP